MLRTRSPRKEKISNCYLHSNSLSNKMDNSLLAVRDINHKYIVVGWKERSRRMTYSEIRKNEEVLTFIKKGNANLGAMGFTDHSEAHSGLVAERAAEILKKFGYPEKILNL